MGARRSVYHTELSRWLHVVGRPRLHYSIADVGVDTVTEFKPFYTPQEMLALGVFDGCYFDGSPDDIPDHWYVAPQNYFAPNVGQSRDQWQAAGWINPVDPLGWFQWYVRYSNGRRIPDEDQRQIGRWASFGARHGAQVRKYGEGDPAKRPRQRQGLLHWAHNPMPDKEA